jgi:hypothetical protein
VWAVAIGTTLGAAGGAAEGVALYPFASWPAVTLYVAVLGALAAALLGLLTGSALLLLRLARR